MELTHLNQGSGCFGRFGHACRADQDYCAVYAWVGQDLFQRKAEAVSLGVAQYIYGIIDI
jgi:hypothetical protein